MLELVARVERRRSSSLLHGTKINKMETVIKMNVNEVKKELYKSKVNVKFSHYVSGNLYYTVELSDGIYQFPLSTIEDDNEIGSMADYIPIRLSSDLGTTSFENEMKASELNRWIAKSIEKNEFIKIS